MRARLLVILTFVSDADLEHASVHDVATLLKRFFSQLSECILKTDLYEAWMSIAEVSDVQGRVLVARSIAFS